MCTRIQPTQWLEYFPPPYFVVAVAATGCSAAGGLEPIRSAFLLDGAGRRSHAAPQPRSSRNTPASVKYTLASRGDEAWPFQGRSGLVDLSQTPGRWHFFSGGAPDLGNGTSKSLNRGVLWRFVTTVLVLGRCETLRPHVLPGAATGLVAHFRCGL